MRQGSLSFALVCALVAGPAFAQTRDPAGAEVLYRAGREAAKRGDWAGACLKLAESQRLDPAPGTLLNLADCEEHQGHLAAAWQHYLQAQANLKKNDSRVAFARERASALEKLVPRIIVRLADGAPAQTRVTRDEQELGAAALGIPLPVDPGEHVVVAKADGRADGRVTVAVAEGETREAVVALGAALPAGAAAPSATGAPPYAPEPRPIVVEHRTTTNDGRPTLGYVLLGAGVVGIATGTVAGVMALSRAGTVKDTCGPGYATCTGASVDAAREGKTFSTISTVAFIAGAAFAGAGLYFMLTPTGAPRNTAIRVAPNGVAVTGAF